MLNITDETTEVAAARAEVVAAFAEFAAPRPATATPPPAASTKKVSFAKVGKKKEETKTAYPVFPDENGQAAIIAARIKKRSDEFDALESALKTDKADLKQMVSLHYFTVNKGKQEIPSSIAVNSPDGEVLVNFQNRYSMLPSDELVVGILGEQRANKYFRQAFELKIKGDDLPQDKAQEIVDKLVQLLDGYGAVDALEVKDGMKPSKLFHTARHSELTVKENMDLEGVCPIVAQVKTKGRGK